MSRAMFNRIAQFNFIWKQEMFDFKTPFETNY